MDCVWSMMGKPKLKDLHKEFDRVCKTHTLTLYELVANSHHGNKRKTRWFRTLWQI